jgi:MFS family permease
MATDVNLKQLERRVFGSYFHDGLWDIYGAFLVLGIGFTMVIGWDYLMLVFAVLAVGLLLFRKRIIAPRLGLVKFSPERQTKTKRSTLIAMIALTFTMLLGVVFFVLFSTNSVPEWLNIWMGYYFLAAFGGIQALLVAIAAYIVGVWRYYVYAALIFIAYVIAGILRPGDMESIPILIAGSIVLVSGVVILARFLRKHPSPSQETDNASS